MVKKYFPFFQNSFVKYIGNNAESMTNSNVELYIFKVKAKI